MTLRKPHPAQLGTGKPSLKVTTAFIKIIRAIRSIKTFKMNAVLAFAFSFALISSAYSYNLGDPFTDTKNVGILYSSHITSLLENSFITGDFERDGTPLGTFRPTSYINRAEFTKVTVLNRLAEERGEKDGWEDMSAITLEDKLLTILYPYYKCQSSICFSDVEEKYSYCDEGKKCEPWYTQYIYYAADKGMVKGTGGSLFETTKNIPRIHAIKMLVINDGEVEPEQDSRYQDLINLTESRNSIRPKCLVGSESKILAKNNTKLLKYALLADRLDFFGNDCELLNDEYGILISTQDIADYLQAPITRQEVTRFLALSSYYSPIAVNPATDSTVNTASQNAGTHADRPYIMPDAGVDESKYFNEDDSSTTRPGQFDDESDDGPVNWPVNEVTEEEELKHETYPDSSCSGDYGQYYRRTHYGDPIALERENTKEQVMDYIKHMKSRRLSDDTIDYYLKQCGLWEVVEDERGDKKPKIPTLKDALYDSYNAYVNKKGYLVEEACMKALRSSAHWEERIPIAQLWCSENVADYDYSDKWRVFEYMYIQFDGGDGGKALDICVDVYTDDKGKVKPQPKLGYILDWCTSEDVSKRDIQNEIDIDDDVVDEDEKGEGEEFKIDDTYVISRKKDNRTTVFKNFKFSKTDTTPSKISNNKPLYIFIHGWDNNPKSWAEKMARSIGGSPQILFLDWSEIVKKDGIEIAPYYEATWIDLVSEKATEALKKWEINNANTTIISHSLGTILSMELAAKLENSRTLKDINLIALDPAYGDYETDNVGSDFKGFDSNGICIVADDSIPGSETLMGECKRRYLIEYDDPMNNSALNDYTDFTMNAIEEDDPTLKVYLFYDFLAQKEYKNLTAGKVAGKVTCGGVQFIPYIGTILSASKICDYTVNKTELSVRQHNWVHKTYNTIVNYPFKDGILSPQNPNNINTILTTRDNSINGIIYTEKEQPEKIKYLKAEEDSGDINNNLILIGNTQSNTIECMEKKECVMYGYHGGDEFHLNINHNNSTIKDFKDNNDEDKLYIEDIAKQNISCFGAGEDADASLGQGGEDVEVNGCTGYGDDTSIKIGKYFFSNGIIPGSTEYRTITLEGSSVSEVDGWMKIARDDTDYYTEQQKKDNSIYIK